MDGLRLHDTVHSAADYIAAWDRMRSVFTAQHVTNAEFAWCPLALGFKSGVAPSYYPGDGEVDWVCADVYSPISGTVKSFASLAQPFLSWAKGHPHKPIMFGEFGAAENWGSNVRAHWLAALGGVVKTNPQIKALVYYNSNAGQARYSLQPDPGALAALAAVAKAAPAKYR
jgi:beta-mannanase